MGGHLRGHLCPVGGSSVAGGVGGGVGCIPGGRRVGVHTPVPSSPRINDGSSSRCGQERNFSHEKTSISGNFCETLYK